MHRKVQRVLRKLSIKTFQECLHLTFSEHFCGVLTGHSEMNYFLLMMIVEINDCSEEKTKVWSVLSLLLLLLL